MASSSKFSFDLSKFKAGAADYSSSESDGDDADEYLLPSRNPESEFVDHNPRKRRRTGRDAKESAALGVFGSDSEDDRRFKHKNLRKKGVSFVSSANRRRDSDDEDDDDDDDDEKKPGEEDDVDSEYDGDTMKAFAAAEEEDDEEEEAAAGVGLGFRGAAAGASQGLGWAPPTQPKFNKPATTTKASFIKSSFDDAAPLGPGFIPSSAAAPQLEVEDDEPAAPRTAMPSAFSQTRNGKTKIQANSFAARMMAKMGYKEGQGLGKEGSGRSAIIEANLRPQGVGLGAVKEKTEQERQEEKRQQRMRGETVVDSDEEEKKKKAARRKKAQLGGIRSGSGSAVSTPRPKSKYLTMDEVKKAAPGLNIPDAFTPILDMTGPGSKLLTSSSGIMTPTSGPAPTESVEDAEARKLVRRAQAEVAGTVQEWKSLQERKAYAELRLQEEQQELQELVAALEGNKSIINLCAEITEHPESGLPDVKADLTYKLGQIIAGLKTADTALATKDMLPQVRDEFGLLAVAVIHPPLKEFLQVWDPLAEPKPAFVDGLVSIKSLLCLSEEPWKSRRRGTATPFEAMMYKLWLPTAAAAVREWNVRDSDTLLALFEAWRELMPSFVHAQLLQDIERKLDEALKAWEPKRKKHQNLPHVWIFPWLQYLPSHHLDPKSSTGLVADVKRKFRALIDSWEFNRGVIPGFKEWKNVLRPSRSRDQWTPLIMNHLLPSMARYLRAHFRIDPQDQAPYLDALEGVLQWLDVLAPSMVGEVLVAELFPPWHDALHQWLVLPEGNLEEIGEWFQWWQDAVFPDAVKALPSVQAEFDKGAALIEQALLLGDEERAALPPPQKGPALPSERKSEEERHRHRHRHHHDHHQQREREAETTTATAPKQPEEEVTFRHVVEDWCQENDLQFLPERKQVHAEGPLYRITARGDGRGGVLGYFKGDRLVVSRKDKQVLTVYRDQPAGWEQLLGAAS